MVDTELLKDRLKRLNKSLADVAIATGISYGVVANIFNGYQPNPTLKTIIPICEYLNLRPEAVWDRANDIKGKVRPAEIAMYSSENARKLKLFEQEVCAGNGNFLNDSGGYTLIEFFNPPKTASFCIRIQGESMMPVIKDGEIVYVQERDKTTMLAGDVGIFCYQGDFYCKVLGYRQNLETYESEIVLSSYNPKHKDIVIEQPEELHFIGRVL